MPRMHITVIADASLTTGLPRPKRLLWKVLTRMGWTPTVGVSYSLEDEGHGLLPVLPLERQRSCEHLKLQSNTEQGGECSDRLD